MIIRSWRSMTPEYDASSWDVAVRDDDGDVWISTATGMAEGLSDQLSVAEARAFAAALIEAADALERRRTAPT